MSDEDVMLPLRAGLLGFPVAHSLSPVMHNAAYEALGLPWHYELCPCQTHDDAAVFLAGAESDGFLGLNVTMPYKKLALSAASVPDRMAELAGGANVLTFCDGECFCANTDGAGIVAALEGEGGLEVSGGTFLVCGTGPTAGAAASALVLGGASLVFVMSRKAASARAFTAAVGLDRLVPVTYGEAADVLPRVSGVVDATPVGMKAGDVSPLPGTCSPPVTLCSTWCMATGRPISWPRRVPLTPGRSMAFRFSWSRRLLPWRYGRRSMRDVP